MDQPPVLTSSKPLSTLQKQFACARLSRPCLPGSSSRLFCNVHHRRLYGLFIVKRFQSGDLSFLLSQCGDDQRGSPLSVSADQSRHILVCGGSKGSEP